MPPLNGAVDFPNLGYGFCGSTATGHIREGEHERRDRPAASSAGERPSHGSADAEACWLEHLATRRDQRLLVLGSGGALHWRSGTARRLLEDAQGRHPLADDLEPGREG